jgi:hypothetical protein
MTVKELISLLKKFDKTKEVVILSPMNYEGNTDFPQDCHISRVEERESSRMIRIEFLLEPRV